MNKVLRDKKGFTLIEILVTVAILGLIMGAMSMTVQTLLKNSGAKKAEAIALRQVENAGFWISRDIQSADTTSSITPGSSPFLSIVRHYWNGTSWEQKEITYQIDDSVMTRNEGSGSMFIAEYIDTDNTLVELTGDSITYDITITADYAGKATKTGTYKAQVRIP